jgi:hypothetical protein
MTLHKPFTNGLIQITLLGGTGRPVKKGIEVPPRSRFAAETTGARAARPAL